MNSVKFKTYNKHIKDRSTTLRWTLASECLLCGRYAKIITKRNGLKLLTLLCTVIGFALLIGVLFSTLSINPKQENEAWGACDLSGMEAGSVRKCRWASVYRRTAKDIQSVDKYTNLLADPHSQMSDQPEESENKWRSENREYFVYRSFAPKRYCAVNLMQPTTIGWQPNEYEALKELPYFTEQCEGRTWDTSGRLYSRAGYPPELNLSVPTVRWVSPTSVLIHTD